MSGDTTRLAILLGALFIVLGLGFYGILLLRKWLYPSDEDESREEADALYTTAEVERMREEGLIDEKQYDKLMEEVREAAKRRAEADKRRESGRKKGLFR